MTFRAVTPAPMAEVLELYTTNGLAKPIAIKAALLQGARAESIGFYAGDRMIGAALLYPAPAEREGEDLRELVFACRLEAARHLTAIVHTARLTAARFAQIEALRIRARVRAGHRPGRRLAALCGLRFIDLQGRFETWEWTHERLR